MNYKRIQITVPHDPTLGKNKALKYGNRRVGKDAATSANQDGISIELRGQMNAPGQNIRFETGKVSVSIHVIREKNPAIRERADIDPVNFQPFILDAVAKGISVDDTWFESHVTWEVDPDNKGIVITVEQGEKAWWLRKGSER